MAQNAVETQIRLVGDKVCFQTINQTGVPITIDSPSPYGDGQGDTPLALFLTSFAGCAAMSLLTLLRNRMRKTVTGMTAQAVGVTKDEHPKAFSSIQLKITLVSPDATEKETLRALDSVENKICPVWAMIRGNVQVDTTIDFRRE